MVASVPYNSLVSFKKLHIYDLCTVDDDQGGLQSQGETVNQNIICSQVGQIGLRTFHLHALPALVGNNRVYREWGVLVITRTNIPIPYTIYYYLPELVMAQATEITTF